MNTKYKFDDFEIDFENCLGKGGYGAVYKATEKNSGKVYAVKTILNNKYNDEEINNMLSMNESENSIKYYGFFIKENIIYLIMELCDCSLDQIIDEKKEKKFNEKEIKELLEQLNKVWQISI